MSETSSTSARMKEASISAVSSLGLEAIPAGYAYLPIEQNHSLDELQSIFYATSLAAPDGLQPSYLKGKTAKERSELVGKLQSNLYFTSVHDAFAWQASQGKEISGKNHRQDSSEKFLPREILSSRKLNRELRMPNFFPTVKNNTRNVLSDPRSGLVAGISVKFHQRVHGVVASDGSTSFHAESVPEVIIDIPEPTNRAASNGKSVRSFFSSLGTLPPAKKFEQTVKLVRQMERHIQELNAFRSSNKLSPCTLTVVGHGEGGDMAVFATLSAGRPEGLTCIAINPLGLSSRERERIDPTKLANATRCVRTITVAGSRSAQNANRTDRLIGEKLWIPNVPGQSGPAVKDPQTNFSGAATNYFWRGTNGVVSDRPPAA